MKQLIRFFFLLLLPIHLGAQSTLSGIINDYTAVSAINPCDNSVQVADISAFQGNDRVLIVQMQGAQIAADDNADFGNILSLESAGLYEKATIAGIAGDLLFLENTLLNDYDVNGKVQLVRIPVYTDAQVVGPLIGKAWDGTTGGIIALEVDNTLEFLSGGNIDASGLGFRGGIAQTNLPNDCSWLFPQNDYFYPIDSWRAAAKGESIAFYLNAKEAGKGAPANGGGGGNDHNSGGGGAAHFGAGGAGGINDEPSTFGCKGNHPGLGGKALPTGIADRIFMGGGGGAGHENNNRATDGGAGGGIILIRANNIRINNPNGNNFIATNGVSPPQTSGDGGGGGGAAGDCLLDINTMTIDGSLDIEALGGAGGEVDNGNQARCHGPGGGGGGGRVLLHGLASIPAGGQVALAGGTAGRSTNSSACADGNNGAQNGSAGKQDTFDDWVESSEGYEALSIVQQPLALVACVGEAISFSVAATGLEVLYQWEVDRGSGFEVIMDGGVFSGSQTATLNLNPLALSNDNWRFRCRVSNDCFGSIFSQAALLEVAAAPTALFTLTTNLSTATFINLSTDATTYLWDFGDGQSSTEINPMHTYAMDGSYTVTLTASNVCGSETFILEVIINSVLAPVALFTASAERGCVPFSVQFSDQSTNNATSWQWTFPGGTPASSTLPNPSVVYNTPGVYDVTLAVSNSAGMDERSITDLIVVEALPNPLFTVSTNLTTATFINFSSDATAYLWDFGDGQSSTESNPIHTYAMDGSYTVTLTASNACGSETFILEVIINSVVAPVALFTASAERGCVPFSVQFNDQSTNNATSWQWTFPGGNPANSTLPNPSVVYNTPGVYDVTLAVSNSAGTDEVNRSNFILVEDLPSADFTVNLNTSTATFINLSSDANTYFWDFGDGQNSTEMAPTHTYAAEGSYLVTLTASNDCGSDTFTFEVTIVLSQAPVANFTLNQSQGCTPLTVQFSDLSTNDATAWQWTFPGGNPATSTLPNPEVIYEEAGTFEVRLLASNAAGMNEIVQENVIQVRKTPVADFTYVQDGFTFEFTSTAQDAEKVAWDFGDGSPIVIADNPVHTYPDEGTYLVVLTASNPFCSAIRATPVGIYLSAIADPLAEASHWTIWPNPSDGRINLSREIGAGAAELRILDCSGRLVREQALGDEQLHSLDMSQSPAGLYYLQLREANRVSIKKLVIF